MYEMIYVYLVLISVTDGLHCIVCSSATNVVCADSFSGDKSTSSSLSQSDFTSCLVSDNFYTGFFFIFLMLIDELENDVLGWLGSIFDECYYSRGLTHELQFG
jgi:hypothetical protein